jgi:hypothetical protein
MHNVESDTLLAAYIAGYDEGLDVAAVRPRFWSYNSFKRNAFG